jgi:hypothetical protein
MQPGRYALDRQPRQVRGQRRHERPARIHTDVRSQTGHPDRLRSHRAHDRGAIDDWG